MRVMTISVTSATTKIPKRMANGTFDPSSTPGWLA
jgi:hypothetical protein